MAYVASASRRVQLRILESSFYQATATIVLYSAKDNEVSTDLLLANAFSSRRCVLLPRVIPETRELVIVRVSNGAELVPGSFGLLEPMGSEIVPVAMPIERDVLAFGNAFDQFGFVLLADILEMLNGLVARPDFPPRRQIGLHDLVHFGFYLR